MRQHETPVLWAVAGICDPGNGTPGFTEAGYNQITLCFKGKQQPSGLYPTSEPTGFEPVNGSVKIRPDITDHKEDWPPTLRYLCFLMFKSRFVCTEPDSFLNRRYQRSRRIREPKNKPRSNLPLCQSGCFG